MKWLLFGIGAASTLALIPAAHGSAIPRTAIPETTAPPEVVTIKITITDSSIHMSPKVAPRGGIARFILLNVGKKRHVFALGHLRHATGAQTGFVKALGPAQQTILILFLDYRGTLPYLGTLPADRLKPAMKGTFKIV